MFPNFPFFFVCGAWRGVKCFLLTLYVFYLIAQNGVLLKSLFSFVQNYFAVQARVAELLQKRLQGF